MNTNKKKIVITGAGSGIGRASAQLFLKKGYEVALIGRNLSKLKETSQNNSEALIIKCDVSNKKEVKTAFSKVEAVFGRLDVLFNNAGIFHKSGTIDQISFDDWSESINTNLTGTFLCSREAFKIMKKQEPQGGRIINNGSVSAYVPRPEAIGYTASKHGVTGITKTLSLDGRKFNIACSQIDIGNAHTEITSAISSGAKQANGSIQGEPTFDVSQAAKAILHIAEVPAEANIQFMTLMATKMPFIGRG